MFRGGNESLLRHYHHQNVRRLSTVQKRQVINFFIKQKKEMIRYLIGINREKQVIISIGWKKEISCFPTFNHFSPWVSPTWPPRLQSAGCRCRHRASWRGRWGSPAGEQERIMGRGDAFRTQQRNGTVDASWPGGRGEPTPATGLSSSCPSGRGS